MLSTQYALSVYPTMREGNPIMAMVTSSFVLFLAVKAFGIMFIAGLYRRIDQRSKIASKIGQTVIICMMIAVVGNNLMVISGSAIEYIALSGTPGYISQGNGYFDDDASTMNYTGDRNLYLLSETTQVYILEPISQQATCVLATKGNTAISSGIIASDGYMYLTDGEGLKKKKTRNFGCGAAVLNDTGSSGAFSIISSGTSYRSLSESGGYLYWVIVGNPSTIMRMRVSDSMVSIQYTGAPGVVSQASFSILPFTNGSIFNVWENVVSTASGQTQIQTEHSVLTAVNPAQGAWYNTGLVVTENYILSNGEHEYVYYKSNRSLKSTNDFGIAQKAINLWSDSNVFCGHFTTICMYISTTTAYNAFDFIESGVFNSAGTPESGLVTYISKTITVPSNTYYNNSNIPFTYNLQFNVSEDNYNLYASELNWDVRTISPAGLTEIYSDIGLTCERTSSLYWMPYADTSYTCVAQKSKQLVLSEGERWTNGTWNIQLTETYSGSVATLDSDSWNVLELLSLQQPSIISGASSTPTSTDDIETIGYLDGLVGLLGFGISSTSKLLFALAITVTVVIFGFVMSGKNQFGGMIAGLASYAFFTYIDYIPKWILIIVILVLASKYFR